MSLTSQDWHARFSMQAMWTRSIRNYLYSCAGFAHADQILEVGCGTGVILAEVAGQSSATAYGYDINTNNLLMAMRNEPSSLLTLGDAHHLPFPSSFFNITFCHFLLLWVAHPDQVINEMSRVTKPGGSVLAFAEPDYGGRIDHPPDFIPLGKWQQESLRLQGADPLIGRRLSDIFHQSGLHQIEVGVLGGQWKTPPTQMELDSEWMVLNYDLEQYHPIGWDNQLDKLRSINADSWSRGERILFVPTFYAWGLVPE